MLSSFFMEIIFMMRWLSIIVCCAVMGVAQAHDKTVGTRAVDAYETIDRILVIIFVEHDTVIITMSDLQRPNLDGSTRTLEDLIFEHLIYLDAKRYGMVATIEMGERYFKMLQRANNRTQKELMDIFEAAGYTYEDALVQLARLSIVNEMLDFKIRSRLIVPEREVLAYHNQHPLIEPTSYLVERLFVAHPTYPVKNMQMYKKVLRDQVAQHKITDIEKVEFWVKENELAEDKRFIAQLPLHALSSAQEVEDGFEFFIVKEIKPEHVVPLEERRLDIIRDLTQPRYEKLFGQYRDGLRESATIVHYT